MELTKEEQRIVEEQCKALPCLFWSDRDGCDHPHKASIKPERGCYTKETAYYFVREKLCQDTLKV